MRLSGRRASPAAPSGRAGGCWAHTDVTCFRRQIAQGRLSATARINTRWWEFQQRVGKRSLRSDCQHARPVVQGRLAGGGSQTGRHFTRPGRGEFSQESRRLRSKSSAHFHTHHDELCTGELAQVPGMYPAFFGWPQRRPRSRRRGQRRVAPQHRALPARPRWCLRRPTPPAKAGGHWPAPRCDARRARAHRCSCPGAKR